MYKSPNQSDVYTMHIPLHSGLYVRKIIERYHVKLEFHFAILFTGQLRDTSHGAASRHAHAKAKSGSQGGRDRLGQIETHKARIFTNRNSRSCGAHSPSWANLDDRTSDVPRVCGVYICCAQRIPGTSAQHALQSSGQYDFDGIARHRAVTCGIINTITQ